MRNDDEMLRRILERLDAIERRMTADAGRPFVPSGPGVRDVDPRDGRSWFGGPDDRDWHRQGHDNRSQMSNGDGGCRFNEKRLVDQIVHLMTRRLEELLQVLPQLIQVETRPARKEPPAAPPPPAQ